MNYVNVNIKKTAAVMANTGYTLFTRKPVLPREKQNFAVQIRTDLDRRKKPMYTDCFTDLFKPPKLLHNALICSKNLFGRSCILRNTSF